MQLTVRLGETTSAAEVKTTELVTFSRPGLVLHAVRVVRRKRPLFAALPPQHRLAQHEEVLDEILGERVTSSRGRQVPRGVKRKMSGYPLRPRTPQPTTRIDFSAAIRIAK
jgi:DNA-binding cell septation regulator SpoVG